MWSGACSLAKRAPRGWNNFWENVARILLPPALQTNFEIVDRRLYFLFDSLLWIVSKKFCGISRIIWVLRSRSCNCKQHLWFLRLLPDLRFAPNNCPTSDTSEAQFRRTSDLVDLTKSTASSVDGASRGISVIDHKVDVVMGALPQIQQGVAQFTSDVPMLHSSITSMEQSMERRLQAIERVTSCILPDFQTRLDQLPLRIEESLAASTALAGRSPSVEASGLNVIKSATSTTLGDMVLSFDRYRIEQR